MNDVLKTALSGLNNASNRAAQAADRIVRVGAGLQSAYKDSFLSAEAAQNANAGAPQQGKPQTQRRGGGSSNMPLGPQMPRTASGQYAGARYIPSMEEEVVQLRVAAQAYKANAKLIRAADEMLETVIESLGDRDNSSDK